MKVSVSKAAKEMGVAIETLGRRETAGKIEVERTPRGHRRYDLARCASKEFAPAPLLRLAQQCVMGGFPATIKKAIYSPRWPCWNRIVPPMIGLTKSCKI